MYLKRIEERAFPVLPNGKTCTKPMRHQKPQWRFNSFSNRPKKFRSQKIPELKNSGESYFNPEYGWPSPIEKPRFFSDARNTYWSGTIMSRVSAISSSDHLRRRKRLFAFNRRHQDKAFRFLKYSLFLWKRQNLFLLDGTIRLEDISKITVSKAIFL